MDYFLSVCVSVCLSACLSFCLFYWAGIRAKWPRQQLIPFVRFAVTSPASELGGLHNQNWHSELRLARVT